MRTRGLRSGNVLTHQRSIGRQVTDSRVDLRERYAQLHTSRVMDYSYLNTLN